MNFKKSFAFECVVVFLIYLVIVIAMFWPIAMNMNKMVAGGAGGDTGQSMWELWWTSFSVYTLHSSPYYTFFVYFPIGANLATQTFAPLLGLIMAPLQALSVQFELNFILITAFALAGLFMYALALHFVHNKPGAFVAGFIYAFAPMHVAQSFGHLQWISIGFIPLLILLIVKMLESVDRNKHIYAVLAGLDLLLVTFAGDVEQGIVALLILVIALAYYAAFNRKILLNKGNIIGIAEMLAVFFVLGLPFIIPITSFITSGALKSINMQSSISYNELYSPDLLSFLVPSYMNPVLGGISNKFSYIYAQDPTERVVYIGYTVLALAILGVYSDRKNGFKRTRFFIFAALLFLLLTYGPQLQVNGTVTQIPGIYYIIHYIPLLNSFREPGRFDMAMMLFVAMLAAFGVESINKALGSSRNKFYFAVTIILVLLLFEYNIMPNQSLLRSEYTYVHMPKAYTEINSIAGNFSVLVLPAVPDYYSSAPALYQGMAMYYQTAMKKPLVGGYTTRSNNTEQYELISMPMIQEAAYAQDGAAYESVINGNVVDEDLLMLKAYNVGFVSVIRSAYNTTELNSLLYYISTELGNPLYVSNTTIVFSTANALSSFTPSAPIIYAPILAGNPYSIMQPGTLLCGNSLSCTGAFKSMWWPELQYTFFNVYSSKTSSAMLSFEGMAYQNAGSVYVYDDGSIVGTLHAALDASQYLLNISLDSGINQIALVPAGNATVFGLRNISVNYS